MTAEFYFCLGAGFIAELVDGTLGMAYGVTGSSLLLSFGLPPATSSATVHAAECFTTGASGLSHHAFRNINATLFKKLLLPGIVGAVVGAYILSNFPGQTLRPFVASYLILMGVIIILKGFREFPPRAVTTRLVPLGFFGALVDALGGGGWGPIVASTLIARGHSARETVGSVNAVEFFVTVAASVTFIVTLGVSHWQMILGLALGGVPAAPLGAWACRRLPLKPLMIMVGALVIVLGLRTLLALLR